MKKIPLYLLAAAGLMTASCSSDEPMMGGGAADGNVTFAIQLPGSGPESRAISDGLSADELTIAVYKLNTSDNTYSLLYVEPKGQVFENKVANVQIPLVNGVTYRIAFFAKEPSAPYTITDDGKLTVDYSAAEANNDIYDAFYATADVAVSNSTMEQNVTLKRPFAQVNVGATDWTAAKKAGYVVEQTAMSFTAEVYTEMNLLDGTVDAPSEVTYSFAQLPDAVSSPELAPAQLTVADAEYDWVAMNYVLVGTDKEVVNTVTFTYQGPDQAYDIPVNAVPVQRNHRTNIVGRFFTQDVDYKIIIDEQFDEPDFDVQLWDGQALKEPAIENNAYQITNAAEWAWMAKNSKANAQQYDVNVVNDIDFNGHVVPCATLNSNRVVNGNSHTLSNIVLGYYQLNSGLFNSHGLNMNDITIENVSYTTDKINPFADNFVGVIAGVLQDGGCNVTLTNVHLKNINLKGVHGVGSFVGFISQNSTLTLNNCSVEDANISNFEQEGESGFIGGLVGKATGMVTGSGNSMTNVTVDAVYVDKRGEQSVQAEVGYYKGTEPSKVNTLQGTTQTNVVVNKTFSTAGLAYPENSNTAMLLNGKLAYYDKFEEALKAANGADEATIYLKEGATMPAMPDHVGTTAKKLVIHANGADFQGKDIAIDTYSTGNYPSQLSSDQTIEIYDARNLYIWGEAKNDVVRNIKLVNFVNEGTSQVKQAGRLIYLTGTVGTTNIEIENCNVSMTDSPVYSNCKGDIKINNTQFTDCAVPVNINFKDTAATTQNVSIDGCAFNRCGATAEMSAGMSTYAAPIRVVKADKTADLSASTLNLSVTNTTVANTLGTNGDVLLTDTRAGYTAYPVNVIAMPADLTVTK